MIELKMFLSCSVLLNFQCACLFLFSLLQQTISSLKCLTQSDDSISRKSFLRLMREPKSENLNRRFLLHNRNFGSGTYPFLLISDDRTFSIILL